MDINIFVFLIPLSLLAMVGEHLLVRKLYGVSDYKMDDLVTNVYHGWGFHVFSFFCRIVNLKIYDYFFRKYALFDIPNSFLSALIVLILVDGIHSRYHLLLHRINCLWGFHVIHHASRRMNFSVSLRIGWYESPFYTLLDLGFAFMGVPIEVLFTALLIRVNYQFFTHTELIKGKMWLDWLFTSPRHHRIHHAKDTRYRDSNYAGIFSIWDTIFRTRTVLEEKFDYGILNETEIANPFWENIYYYRYMTYLFKRTQKISDKFKVIFGPPGFVPSDINREELNEFLDKITYRKMPIDSNLLSMVEKIYLLIGFIASTMFLICFFYLDRGFPFYKQVIVAFFCIFSFSSLGILLERRNKSWIFEHVRLIGHLMIPYFLFGKGFYFLNCVSIFSILYGISGLIIFHYFKLNPLIKRDVSFQKYSVK